jgi:hypothetical protein
MGNQFKQLEDGAKALEKKGNVQTESTTRPEQGPAAENATRKRSSPKKPKLELKLNERTRRRNLTLKVLEKTEEQFHQLYLQLQIRGDSRKKQDLAEEACQLLFERYESVLKKSLVQD